MPFERKYKIVDTVSLDPKQIMDMQFYDNDGNGIKITDSAKPDSIPTKLSIKVEATHSGINKNYHNYLSDKMAASAHTWTADFQKPVIMNHNIGGTCTKDASEPIGRVVAYEFKQSVLDQSKHTILLTLSITDKSAIEKFLDGRYQTFSVAAYVDSITCGICQKDIIAEDFCGHKAGKKYKKKVKNEDDSETEIDETCIWTMGNFDYYEISVVNRPADPLATTMSIEVVNDQTLTDAINNPQNITDSVDQNVLNALDSIDDVLQSGNPQNTDPIKDDDTSSAVLSIEGNQASNADFNNIEDVLNYVKDGQPCSLLSKDSFADMVHVIKDAYKAYQEDKAALELAKTELKTSKTELANAQSALTEAKNKAQADDITHKALIDQNLSLSKMVRDNLVDQLVMIRSIKDAAFDSENSKTELKTLSTKRLYEFIKEESANLKQTRRPTPLENPGLSDSDGNAVEKVGYNKSNTTDATILINAATRFFANPSAAMS